MPGRSLIRVAQQLMRATLVGCAALVLFAGFISAGEARTYPFNNGGNNTENSQANAPKIYAIILVHDLPPEARETLDKIKSGATLSYRQDGSIFGNREGFLPRKYHGYYTEYTVITPGSRDRGARRIIAGAGKERNPSLSGEYYYSDDHYQSFKRIIER
jgi:ribonuclease T1